MTGMRVYLGGDHAGYEFKQAIIAHLTKAGHEPIDCGAFAYDAEDDYPGVLHRRRGAHRRRPGQPGNRARWVG